MIILLSPAKTLEKDPPVKSVVSTRPTFTKEANQLAQKLKKYSDLNYAQIHLRILSGLYGILRPLDTIQAYRLEMGTSWSHGKGKDLAAFWKSRISQILKEDLRQEKEPVLVNLASREYSQAIDFKSLKTRVIEVGFKDFHNGKYQFLTVWRHVAFHQRLKQVSVYRILF